MNSPGNLDYVTYTLVLHLHRMISYRNFTLTATYIGTGSHVVSLFVDC